MAELEGIRDAPGGAGTGMLPLFPQLCGEDSLRNCAFGPGGKSSVGDRARVTDTFSSVTLPTVKLVTAKL